MFFEMEKNIDIQKSNDTIKAITESLNNFAGTLTGKNLEEKLVEYSEIYGEILLYLYQEQENQKKEIRHLKKEILRLEEKIIKNTQTKQQEKSLKSKNLLYVLIIFSLLLNLISLVLIYKFL